jgi:hypothetical protein
MVVPDRTFLKPMIVLTQTTIAVVQEARANRQKITFSVAILQPLLLTSFGSLINASLMVKTAACFHAREQTLYTKLIMTLLIAVAQ